MNAPKNATDALQHLTHTVEHTIEEVRGSKLGPEQLTEQTVRVTEALLDMCRTLELKTEREQRGLLARMVDDPQGCTFTTLFTDRVPRALTAAAAVHAGHRLLRELGPPEYFGKRDRILLRAFGAFGRLQPALAAGGVRRHLRQETSRYLLPDESSQLPQALREMQKSGVRVNVNHLGEEILSGEEAESHLQAYERLLELPEVDTVSVKISSICERLNPVAFEDGVERIGKALRRVYRAAGAGEKAKLVMLDMEAYKDLELSVEAFIRVAAEPEFIDHRVGIVLQAYIPDSHAVQEQLLQWARVRRDQGGRPMRMRLVKGANLAMEHVLEEQRGWANPVYPSKHEVDSSFRRMLAVACRAEHSGYLIQGVASHNLFDVALTLLLRSSLGGENHVEFEILAGMAEPLKRTLAKLQQPTLVYCPTVSPKQYHTAVAYLVRRLDENTTPGNFLCSGFGMNHGDEAWRTQRKQFVDAAAYSTQVSTTSRRTVPLALPPPAMATGSFVNEHDSDFCNPAAREALSAAIARLHDEQAPHIGLSIGGQWQLRDGQPGFDPSLPRATPYHTSMATPADIEQALESGAEHAKRMRKVPALQRARWLLAIADKFREHRFDLIARTMQDGGKIAAEADAEVSEAIDFAEYYARSALELNQWHEVKIVPRGLTVVTPPWNFPLAIALGGCFAALATGNPAIVKPAPETPGIATYAVQLCYEAGLPPELLQLIVATDEIATPLITDRRVRSVILTGASDTARLFRRLRPSIHLLAETGGKNTLIVTAHADLDAAVSAAADSAFGHSGQKCSAASLLILQDEVRRSSHFLDRLVSATTSRRVGSVWDLATDQGPLIHPPSGPLLKAIEASRKDPGWVLKPEQDSDNPRLITPGICEGVQVGSMLHDTELFGPVLGVMQAKNLSEALRLANDTPYGLTAGLMSLDEDEQRLFSDKMDAGNLYINRATTGAIVQRQPFGGRKTSSFGPGAKAGGPNYLLELVKVKDRGRPAGANLPPALQDALKPIAQWLPESNRDDFWTAAASYQRARRDHFGLDHDPSNLHSQRNVFRYQPAEYVLLWVGREPKPLDLALSLAALAHSQVRFDLALLEPNDEVVAIASHLRGSLGKVLGEVAADQSAAQLFSRYRRVRCIGDFPASVHRAKNQSDAYFERATPLRFGRIELLRYYQEQSVSVEVHRYGNLQASILCPVGTPPSGPGTPSR